MSRDASSGEKKTQTVNEFGHNANNYQLIWEFIKLSLESLLWSLTARTPLTLRFGSVGR